MSIKQILNIYKIQLRKRQLKREVEFLLDSLCHLGMTLQNGFKP
jgi:hypothetical protein